MPPAPNAELHDLHILEFARWQGTYPRVVPTITLHEHVHLVLVEEARVAGHVPIERHQLKARPVPVVGGQHDDDDDDDDDEEEEEEEEEEGG